MLRSGSQDVTSAQAESAQTMKASRKIPEISEGKIANILLVIEKRAAYC